MKKLLFIISLLMVGRDGFAQTQFSLPIKNTVKHALVLIEQNNVLIQGYAGNEVQVAIEKPISFPEVANGLKILYKKGLNDNTELGLNISQEDSVLIIREVCNCYSGKYLIKIPQILGLTMLEYSTNWGKNWEISDMSGNIDLNSEFGNLILKNLSGNVFAKTRHGKIEADFNEIKKVSLTSNFSKVLLDINENTKANLKITDCRYGDIFTDFVLPELTHGQKELTAQLNGGGNSIIELRSDHSDIYLRKRKKTQ